MKKIEIYIYALLAMLCWGISFVWLKIAYEFYRPLTVVFLRLVIAVILLKLVFVFSKRKLTIRKGDKRFFYAACFF